MVNWAALELKLRSSDPGDGRDGPRDPVPRVKCIVGIEHLPMLPRLSWAEARGRAPQGGRHDLACDIMRLSCII